MRLFILLLFLCHKAEAQVVEKVYSIYEATPCAADIDGDNIVVLSPLPFDVSYMVELTDETCIQKISIDRISESITISAFIDGGWVVYSGSDRQIFSVGVITKYLLVEYRERANKIYLLIE